jgi:hypothetical protein
VEKVELNPGKTAACNSYAYASIMSYNIVFCCSWGIELYSVVLLKCFHGSSHNTSGFSFVSVFAFL